LWLSRMYSPALLSSLPSRFGAVLRRRMERCFALHPNRTNPYAHAMLLGCESKSEAAPAPDHATSRIELVADDAASYLERCAPDTFEGVSVSNILDGASIE